jgi:hypothetical protein
VSFPSRPQFRSVLTQTPTLSASFSNREEYSHRTSPYLALVRF